MAPDGEGFLYPEINEEKCIHCNKCIEICPVINKNNKIIDNNYPKAYAVINNNEIIRNQSTSGGIFTLLAEEIINQEGIVFGAKFDTDFDVIHSSTNTIDGIGEFRRSKYVQSNIGETFKECKNYLDSRLNVLFSGTPCQIGGLKSYLQKDYDNLFCVDLICMSVPSPKVWKKYMEYQIEKNKSHPKKIAFRHKETGWKQSSLYIEFENNTTYIARKDPFLRIFGAEICTRRSCFECNFRTLKRQSDITIADFWGIEHIFPEMDDNKGTSLVLINSLKGEQLFGNISEKYTSKSVDIEKAIKYNSRAVHQGNIKQDKIDKKRKKFYKNFEKKAFDTLVKRYVYDPLPIRGYRFIRRCLAKIKRMIIK
jgi:coenzyme F420-reducing hydrogenase beta subunit